MKGIVALSPDVKDKSTGANGTIDANGDDMADIAADCAECKTKPCSDRLDLRSASRLAACACTNELRPSSSLLLICLTGKTPCSEAAQG